MALTDRLGILSFIGHARAAMLSVLVLVPVPVIAQTTAFGVQGGVSLGNIHFSSPVVGVAFDNRVGVAVGGFLAWDFNRHVGLQIDALYIQKGTRSTDLYWDQYGQGGLKARLDYVEIAVPARVSFRAADNVTIRAYAGPAFAFKVVDKQVLAGFELTGPPDKFAIKPYDIGLAVGGAVQLRKVFVDVRYTIGLLNVDDDPADDDLVLIENRALTFMVGFTIR
jgi:hypothetical protein